MEILSRRPELEQHQTLGVLFPDRAAARDEWQPPRRPTPLPHRRARGGFIKAAIKKRG